MYISRKEWLYPSNLLSLFRLVGMPFPVWAVAVGNDILALILIAVGVITDLLDGYLARRLNQVSELGKILDPLGDKLAIGALAITLSMVKDFPVWAAALIVIRDLSLLIGGIYFMTKKVATPTSNLFGKVTALTWSVAIISYLTPIVFIQKPLVYLAAALVPISFGLYLIRTFRQAD